VGVRWYAAPNAAMISARAILSITDIIAGTFVTVGRWLPQRPTRGSGVVVGYGRSALSEIRKSSG